MHLQRPTLNFVATILRDIHKVSCSKHKLKRLASSHNIVRSIASTSRARATHRDPSPSTSSLLNQAFEVKHGSPRQQDNVGPFQLGIGPQAYENVNVKKWNELNAKGKVARATARTTNFAVILLGAGFTAVLVYALTSEMFAKNSPTVLFNDACERIKNSPQVAKHLHYPLTFHNNPPSTSRPRHRNHHVSSQMAMDVAGREHMLLTFYIHAPARQISKSSESDSDSDMSFSERMSCPSGMNHEEMMKLFEQRWETLSRKAKRLFLYLIGGNLPSTSSAPTYPIRKETQIGRESRDEKAGVWSFAGLLSGLRGSKPGESSSASGDDRIWEEGEVHADLVKGPDGNFTWRYIIVDLPNSRTLSKRLYVERSRDVSEAESRIRWS